MTWTAPPLPDPSLGRGVVISGDDPIPEPWTGADAVEITEALLEDAKATNALIDRLHRAWMSRTPLVIRWRIRDETGAAQESFAGAAHEWSADQLFPLERLRFLCFANNYDGRSGELKWWWTVKAARHGVEEDEQADGRSPDGVPLWIDGGPRGPRPDADGVTVLSGEDVDAGRLAAPAPAGRPAAADLADDQRAAVELTTAPARIIAPAGSGKTRTLATRVSHLVEAWGVEPSQIWAVAYNRRAADELRERVGVPGVNVRTIHSLGWAILQEARPGVSLIGEPDVRTLLNRIYSIPKRVNADPTGQYLEALDQVRAGLRSPEDVEASRDDVPGFADGFDRIRQQLQRRGEADHGEQVYGAIEVLLRDPGLRARWQRRCRHVLVDEFQDLTPSYLLLLRLVASPQLQVFGVGDDDQVIYGYAGADPSFLIEYDDLFPGAAQLALQTNYRCAPAIVDASRHLLGYNRRRIEKQIAAARDEPSEALTVDRSTGPDLAARAADLVAGWIDEGVETGEIAILTRVNASLIPVKAALVGRDIPTTDLLSADSLNRTAVRALFAWIRLALDPETMRTADVIEAIRRPSRGLTTIARETLTRRTTTLPDLAAVTARLDHKQANRWDEFVGDLERAATVAETGSTEQLVRLLTDEIGLRSAASTLDAGTVPSRSTHTDDLVAVRRAAALHTDVSTFIPWLLEAVARPASPGGVTLSSVHRVKGMEWDRVIVFGADRTSMPHELATDREEERRIFHVALTRARDHSLVLADQSRPSRFLDELDGSAAPDRPAVPQRRSTQTTIETGPTIDDRVTLRGGLKGTVSARSASSIEVRLDTGAEIVAAIADVVAVDRTGGADPALVSILREWRREKCKELGVPAYVVLHDATIDAIAARAPADERELSTISGIGPSKLEHYGDEILALVASVD